MNKELTTAQEELLMEIASGHNYRSDFERDEVLALVETEMIYLENRPNWGNLICLLTEKGKGYVSRIYLLALTEDP